MIDPSSQWSADGLVVKGSLTGRANQRYAVQVFIAGGQGGGQTYIGTAAATPTRTGPATFGLMVKIPDVLGPGVTSGTLTATATDSAGSTSRLSAATQIVRK